MRNPFLLALVALLAGCMEAPVSRSVCPATELDALVGRPVVEIAANDSLRPMRVVGPGEAAPADRPERLTIRADGGGRVAALSCG